MRREGARLRMSTLVEAEGGGKSPGRGTRECKGPEGSGLGKFRGALVSVARRG